MGAGPAHTCIRVWPGAVASRRSDGKSSGIDGEFVGKKKSLFIKRIAMVKISAGSIVVLKNTGNCEGAQY